MAIITTSITTLDDTITALI